MSISKYVNLGMQFARSPTLRLGQVHSLFRLSAAGSLSEASDRCWADRLFPDRLGSYSYAMPLFAFQATVGRSPRENCEVPTGNMSDSAANPRL
jgi:hypothetical protein